MRGGVFGRRERFALLATLQKSLEVELVPARRAGNRVQNHAQEREDDAGLARAGRTLDQRDGLLLERRAKRGELRLCDSGFGIGTGNEIVVR
jgi:hypothetical protein